MELLTEPYPHFVLDHFLPAAYADKIYRELRQWNIDESFYKYENVFEKKFAQDDIMKFPPSTAHFMMTTFTAPFISMIETKLGLTGLLPDPALRGGGFHLHKTGGKLDVHKDFDYHHKLKLYRRVNVIWFANKEWDEEWNGALELWNKDMTQCVRKIPPRFNRLVVFETPNAPHGLPDEIKCPPTHRRMSLAAYYYSVEKPEGVTEEHHSTMFLKRPNEETNPVIEALREQRNKGRLESNVK